ncbi:MAG: type IV pilus modification protein PilV [Gammaproteobacteria bacterium]
MKKVRGFTLIELIVLLAIIAILASIAVPNFSATIKTDRDTSQINTLLSGLALARSAAIEHGNATICAGNSTACGSGNWTSGWVVFYTPSGGPGTVIRTFPALAGSALTTNVGDGVSFNQSGLSYTDTTFTTSTAQNGDFELCDSRGASYGRSLSLLPTGRAVIGSKVGFLVDGVTPLTCTPPAAVMGGGASGIPTLALLGGLLCLAGIRKRFSVCERALPSDNTDSQRWMRKIHGFGHRQNRVAGFSLLEVLIALVILSVGLLGIAGLMSTSLKSNDSAYMQSQATTLAYNMIDRMRANMTETNNLTYQVPMPAAPSAATAEPSTCTGTVCTTPALAAYDIAQWEYDLANTLPLGRGAIAATSNGGVVTVTIKVLWNDSRANQALSGIAAPANTSVSVTSALQ